MGILTDFVIAKDEDAFAIGEASRTADSWPTLESKGVDPIKVATLYCSATNMEYTDDIQESFQIVAGNEEDGRGFSSFLMKFSWQFHELKMTQFHQ